MASVDRAVETANLGHDDLARPVLQRVNGMLHQEYSDKRRFVAVLGRADGGTPVPDDVIGYRFLALPRDHNTHTADVYVGVHPDHRRRGIGSALAERTERVAADVPQGELDFGEETWDAERVRVYLEERADSGQRLLAALVEHVPSGEIAGGTSFLLQDDKPASAFQEETMVLKTHGGHRLGMLVKAVNLRELVTRYPRAERVHTWNAEENAHMLGINVALGFRPSGAEAALQKKL